MTDVLMVDGVRIVRVKPEDPDVCDLCGAVEELRPYGPRGASICYDCAMKDEKGTERRMGIALFGEGSD